MTKPAPWEAASSAIFVFPDVDGAEFEFELGADPKLADGTPVEIWWLDAELGSFQAQGSAVVTTELGTGKKFLRSPEPLLSKAGLHLVSCPPTKVAGRVVDQHGRPVVGASVELQNEELLRARDDLELGWPAGAGQSQGRRRGLLPRGGRSGRRELVIQVGGLDVALRPTLDGPGLDGPGRDGPGLDGPPSDGRVVVSAHVGSSRA